MFSGRPILPALFASLTLLAAVGCPRNQQAGNTPPPPPAANTLNPDRSAGAFAQTDPWLLTTTDPNANRGNHGIFLSNGYLGAAFRSNGGMDENSASFLAGLYNQDETLAPADTFPLDLPPSATKGRYSQTLDLKGGVLTTRFGQTVVTTFVSRDDPHLMAMRVTGLPLQPYEESKTVPLTVGPIKVPFIHRKNPEYGSVTDTASEGVSGAQDAQGKMTVAAGTVQTEDKGTRLHYVTFYTARDTRDPETAARQAVAAAAKIGFDTLLKRHEAAWAKRWRQADIVIEGDPEAQQLVHKLMFDLLQSARPGGADSIAPESLSGNFYKGHIFWDAEVWMFPALLAQHPDLARTILDYRFKHLDEAKWRAKAQGFAGADFPWESAATGKETAPGGFATGRHVTAGVGWAHWQYWLATNDKKWLRERGWPVLSAVADHFASRAKKNAHGRYDIRGVFGPDETAGPVDNNTYTNALARYCLLAAGQAAKIAGQRANPAWATVAANIALPYDPANDRYLARENDNGRPTKQADGELVLYPAALPMKASTARNTYAYNAARPIRSGPAMTASIHALLAARLGLRDQAERAFRESYRPFVRGPFLLFSEKRSLDRCVFTTGAGGVLQSVIYGFGDLRWEDFDNPAAASKRPVTLPPTWKKLTITGIQHAGKRYTLTVTPQGRTLTQTTAAK